MKATLKNNILIVSILLLTAILPSCKIAPMEPLVLPITPMSSLNPPIEVSQGYLVKESDAYGRPAWRIGTQKVNPSDEFCILAERDSPTFTDDIFSRNSISVLRTDQLYKLYSCEFRKSDSSRQDSWVEKIWGIQAITDNSSLTQNIRGINK